MKILYADETADLRELMELAWTQQGHEVCIVSNGVQAIEVTESNRFDVMLLSIELPLHDGWKTLTQIRQMPEHQHTPILMMNHHFDHVHREQAAQLGACYLVYKPILPQDLLQLARQCVEETRAR
jgi:DNA-binding response OmpR family regulator